MLYLVLHGFKVCLGDVVAGKFALGFVVGGEGGVEVTGLLISGA